MSRPRLLDLFCGAGGAAVGYHRAGFDVVGVDHKPQPHYPFEFVQWDALDYVAGIQPEHRGNLRRPYGWLPRNFDAVHASPPCQAFTAYRRTGNVGEHPDLIGATRRVLARWAWSLPYVIENVQGAPLHDPLMLCGSLFDPPLTVRRHRYFETNWSLRPPDWSCRHDLIARQFPAATNRKPNSRRTVEVGVWRIPLETQKRAMGVDWDMTLEELSEAIPPAYTELIGAQLLQHIRAATA